MARGSTKTAEPEVEVEDLTGYAEKPITPRMEDYLEWLGEQVPGYDFDGRSVAVGVTLYQRFQASDFAHDRTEARRAERDKAAAEAREAKATAAKAKAAAAGDGKAEQAEAPKRGRGRPSGSGTKPGTGAKAGAKPGTPGRRGRAAKPAEAPF